MRRWTLLLAGAALWLFLAAIPALADGGPHVAATNSGVSSLTADSCAGCHRAHTAQGPLLLNATGDEALCLTCHGAAVTGATTDVMTGIQYVPTDSGGRSTTAYLGALRGGGFDTARLGTPFRIALDNGSGGVSRKSKVQVGYALNVTSAHLEMAANGLSQPGKAWGNGANGSGAGPTVSISCGSCHNPHGNGQYRILNPIPTTPTTGTTFSVAWVAQIVDATVTTNVYRTAASHGLFVGDRVCVAGNSEASANVTSAVLATIPSNSSFTLTGVTVAATGTGGTVTRGTWNAAQSRCDPSGVKVTDAANPTNATRNYTVIQKQAPYLLLASDAASYPWTSGDYWHYAVPWNAVSGSTQDAPNGIPTTSGATISFNEQITAWCSSCHTRYFARSQPTTNPANGTTGAAYNTARPGDAIFTFQHRTNAASGRSCTTCHVSHGSNAVMDGTFSSTFTYPDATASASSRLLKVDNRGTCQLCHDPTGTVVIGDQYPPAPYPVPGAP